MAFVKIGIEINRKPNVSPASKIIVQESPACLAFV